MARIFIIYSIDFILVEIAHHFLKIALCAPHFVIDASLPHTDGTLDIVLRIVIRLNNDEHFLGFLLAETVVERIPL